MRTAHHFLLYVISEVCKSCQLLIADLVVLLFLVLEDGPEDPRVVWGETDAVTAGASVGGTRLK